MKTAVHTYEKHGNERLIFRNGQPIMMAMTCTWNPEDKDHQNVIVMKRIRVMQDGDIMQALVEMLIRGKKS